MSTNVPSYLDIRKELISYDGSPFQFESMVEGYTRKPVMPRLLTALIKPFIKTQYERTDTYVMDLKDMTAQLPSGKAFGQDGKHLNIDQGDRYRFGINSFGLVFKASPMDVYKRVKHGTSLDQASIVDILADQAEKADNAWMLLDELGIGQILTSDTNITRGGPFTVHNYYTTIVGSSRPAAIDMDLGDVAAAENYSNNFSAQRLALMEDAMTSGATFGSVAVVAGSTFFNKVLELEKQSTLARDFVRPSLDLQTVGVPETVFGVAGRSLPYRNFESSTTGIRFFEYTGAIEGSVIIGASDAYMFPLGSTQMMSMAFAPTQSDMFYVTQPAIETYTWTKTDPRQGVTVIQESNKVYASPNPRLIRHLTTST